MAAVTMSTGRTFTDEQLQALGRLNLDNLREEISQVGAEAIWWAVLSAQARRAENDEKLNLDILKAQLAKDYRTQAVARGERATDASTQEAVLIDPRHQDAARRYLNAQESANILESVKFTLARKQSTLEALAGLVVQEIKATTFF